MNLGWWHCAGRGGVCVCVKNKWSCSTRSNGLFNKNQAKLAECGCGSGGCLVMGCAHLCGGATALWLCCSPALPPAGTHPSPAAGSPSFPVPWWNLYKGPKQADRCPPPRFRPLCFRCLFSFIFLGNWVEKGNVTFPLSDLIPAQPPCHQTGLLGTRMDRRWLLEL